MAKLKKSDAPFARIAGITPGWTVKDEIRVARTILKKWCDYEKAPRWLKTINWVIDSMQATKDELEVRAIIKARPKHGHTTISCLPLFYWMSDFETPVLKKISDQDRVLEYKNYCVFVSEGEATFYVTKPEEFREQAWAFAKGELCLGASEYTAFEVSHVDRPVAYISASNANQSRNLSLLVERYKPFLKAGVTRGVLFYGPSRTGKTELARGLSKSLSGRLLRVEELINLNTLFTMIELLEPTAILFDDIDRFNPSDFVRIMHFFDQHNSGVLVLATANSTTALDPALLEASRFSDRFEVGLPGVEDREAILQYYVALHGLKLDTKNLAKLTDKFTGGELKDIVVCAHHLSGSGVDLDILIQQEVERIQRDRKEIERSAFGYVRPPMPAQKKISEYLKREDDIDVV